MAPARSGTHVTLAWARPRLGPCAIFLGAALALPAAAPARAEAVEIAAHADRGGGRLTFEWRDSVTYTVTQAGAHIYIRFSRPLTGDLEPARTTLVRYLAELRSAGAGHVLVIRMIGQPKFSHQHYGRTLTLTWLGGGIAERATPDDATESDADLDLPPQMKRKSRPRGPPALATPKRKASLSAQQASPSRPLMPPETHFDRPTAAPLATPEPRTPTSGTAPPPSRPVGPPTLQIDTPSSPSPVVLAPKAPAALNEAPPARPAERPEPATLEPTGPVRDGPAPKSPTTGQESAPAPPARPGALPGREAPLPQVDAPPAPATPHAENAKQLPSLSKAPEVDSAKPEIRPAPEARAAPEAPREPPAMPAIAPILTVSAEGIETRIAFAWPEPVAAAVFRYGGKVWIVFPRREVFDLKPYQNLLGPGVERLALIDHAQATVVTALAGADVRPQVMRDSNTWTVVLKRESAVIDVPDPKIAIARTGAEQAAVPLAGAEAPIELVDPEVGATLFIVPSRAVAALAGERAFVTFKIVPAMQGAVVEALADGLTVGIDGSAITIRRAGGLLLSDDR